MRSCASKHFSRFHTLLLLKTKLLPSSFTSSQVTSALVPLFRAVLSTCSVFFLIRDSGHPSIPCIPHCQGSLPLPITTKAWPLPFCALLVFFLIYFAKDSLCKGMAVLKRWEQQELQVSSFPSFLFLYFYLSLCWCFKIHIDSEIVSVKQSDRKKRKKRKSS